MLQRLSYIRIAPVAVLDAGCGAAHALEPLRARYPQLDYTGQDICSRLLDVARERYATRPGFLQKLRNKPTLPVRFRLSDLADSGLDQIGRAHVRTPVKKAHNLRGLLREKKNKT